MIKIKLLITIFFTVFFTNEIYSIIHTVTASGFAFKPPLVTVTVGDTVKWQWVDGIHTTTSTSVPSGATTWDAPLDFTNQTYFYRVGVAGNYVYQCTFHFTFGMIGGIIANPIGIKIESSEIPKDYELFQNYPNPFNPVTYIKFNVPELTQVKLKIYDILNQEVATLVNQELKAGSYIVDWDASNFASGAYYYKLETEAYSETKKMILVK